MLELIGHPGPAGRRDRADWDIRWDHANHPGQGAKRAD